MKYPIRSLIAGAAIAAVAATALLAQAHGNVTPQSVNTSSLPKLDAAWRAENPYRNNQIALKVGASAYTQNCARCHGIDAISGGVAPDLRLLDRDCKSIKQEARKQACHKEVDAYYLTAVRAGKVRNGAVYMPLFEGIFNQEAMWAIKTYLEARRESK